MSVVLVFIPAASLRQHVLTSTRLDLQHASEVSTHSTTALIQRWQQITRSSDNTARIVSPPHRKSSIHALKPSPTSTFTHQRNTSIQQIPIISQSSPFALPNLTGDMIQHDTGCRQYAFQTAPHYYQRSAFFQVSACKREAVEIASLPRSLLGS